MTQLLKPGQILADYEIMELVGQGGMGEVYRAKQQSLDRIVAIKTLAPHLTKKDPTFAKRFVEEARAAGRLNHANIVAVHDVDQTQIETAEGLYPVDFFSMEFVDGESVKDVIERDGACKLPLVERVMQGMAEALIYAESQQVIHRDIKPDNIMITSEGVIKLADLGLAVQAGTDSVNEQRDEHGRAKVMGTPLYMSPEQARALPLDPRSDQYSLGATLFHMLTGQPPYRGEDSRAVMRAHVFNPVPDPLALRPELPEGWCKLCRRLMAKSPEERFTNARVLKSAIDAVIAGPDSDIEGRALPAVKSATGRKYVVIGGGVLVLLLALILALVWSLSGSLAPATSADPAKDPVLEAERRIQETLIRLPGDPHEALVVIDRLLADPANASVKTYLDQARSIQTQRQEEQTRRDAEQRSRKAKVRLEAAQKLLDEGRLVQALSELPGSNAVTNDQLPLRAELQKNIEVQLNARYEALAKKIAEANADQLAVLSNEIATVEVQEPDRVKLRATLEAQTQRIKDDEAKRASNEETAIWRTVAGLADGKRGTVFDLVLLVSLNQSRFNTPESLNLVKAIIEVQPLAQALDRLLADSVAQTPRPELLAIVDGAVEKVVVTKLDENQVTLVKVAGNETCQRNRREVLLPISDMLTKAVAKAQMTVDKRSQAAFLWMCRAPEAQAAIAALGSEPLATALKRLESLAPFPTMVTPVLRNEGRITARYDFNDLAAMLQDDFIAQGLTSSPDALVWTATGGAAKGVAPKDDDSVPTLRWRGKLRPPLEWTVGVRLLPGSHTLLVGFDTGKKRVRLGMGARSFPQRNTMGMLVTGMDGAFALAGDDLTLDLRRPTKDGIPVQVKWSVDGQGQVTVQVDGRAAFAPHPQTALPTDTDLTPIIQVLQQADRKTAIPITDLLISGLPPGER